VSRPKVHEAQFSIRMPADFVERADRLAEVIARAPESAAFGISRATVLRMALARGLDALEREHGSTARRKGRR